MLKATLIERVVVGCPVCRQGDFEILRRLPSTGGRVHNRCSCRRCGAQFEYDEDRLGHPAAGGEVPARAPTRKAVRSR